MTDFVSLLPLFASRLGAVLSEIFELRPASIIRAATPWQAFLTNNIDMSSTESSGAPAEATATTPASTAAASFGSTRGSGLARGKRPTNSPVTAATPAATEYTPTAIEVVSAPREYQNPFAPATPEPVENVTPAPVAVSVPAPAAFVSPVVDSSAVDSAKVEAPASDEPAELNILEPEQQKTAPAQTWESEGFRPAREPRNDRPRREESRRNEPRREERTERTPRQESAPFDPASIPEKFLYVRPGYNYVPTPSNYGGAPRENREQRPASAESHSAPAAAAPAKSGGFLGWLKSLFGGSSAEPVAPAGTNGDQRRDSGQRRHRGGRNRGGHGGGEGGQRRSRGGRGRSGGGYRGERSGGAQGGDSTG
jgi:translation initiation factor IF-2